jgi:proline racemase
MEAPAGLVLIEYRQEGKKVRSVKLTNVPAYLAAENIAVECPDLGDLRWMFPMAGISMRSSTRKRISKVWKIIPPGS